MKKIILVVAIFFISFVHAQNNNSSALSIYAGLSYSGMKGDDNRIPGVQIGIGYDINESITIGGGLAHRGGEFNSDNGFRENLNSAKLDGFAVETWMTYSLMSSTSASLWLGPSYSYIFKFQGAEGSGISDTDNDYGVLIGATIPLSQNRSINIGYYNGMTDHNYNNFFIEYGFRF